MSDDFHAHCVKKVQLYLRKHVYDYQAEWGPCLKCVVRHLKSDGTTTTDIHTHNLPRYIDASDAPTMTDLESAANELVNSAMEDADSLNRGVQRYVCMAFHDQRPGESQGRCILVLSGGKESFRSDSSAEMGVGDVGDSETPDARGLMAQHMRFTEAMQKQNAFATGAALRTLVEQNQFLSKNLRELMEKNLQTYAMLEHTLSQQAERDLAAKKQAVVIRGVEDLADKLKILLPHMVNKAVGRKLLPTKSSPGEQELASLVETIRPDQIDALNKTLNPDQMMALLSIMERVLKQSREDEGTQIGAIVPLQQG